MLLPVWSFVAPPAEPGLETGRVPTFSVVVRAYQAAATVGAAVESALNQTVPPLELIVVDDGSTDGTPEALAPYAEEITLIRTDHAGGAIAFNTGVSNLSLRSSRAASLRQRVVMLEKFRNGARLTGAQPRALECSLAANRRRALLAEAETALRHGDPDARRRVLAVAAGSGFGPGARLKAVAAAVAHRAAARRLDAIEATTGWSRLQRGYPRG